MVGLFLIALGTGGIKPCVSAFGGDQFEEEHVRFIFFSKLCSSGYFMRVFIFLDSVVLEPVCWEIT